jgi:integration host factor subunit beta
MNQSQVITTLSQRFPQLGRQDAELAVTEILDAVARALINGRRMEIRGFGSFALNYQPPRTVRNPKTGKESGDP